MKSRCDCTLDVKRSQERAKHLARYSKYGATNFAQFTIRRVMAHVREAWWAMVRILKLLVMRFWRRSASTRHSVFVSLGYNCELAFRYFKSNGFVDSGLFQWGNSQTIDRLTYAIEHLELLFAGEIRGPNPLYQCANTLILQHGKAPMGMRGKSSIPIDLESDREELRGRMAYLKKKFVRVLGEGGALVAYKMPTAEYLDSSAEEKLNRLIGALRKLGMRDATFLLVCETACKGKSVHLDWSDAKIRYVKAFNPDDRVTDAALGDPVGWQLIFDEFRPLVMKKQAHKFKFEK